jgi:hypothetical protein
MSVVAASTAPETGRYRIPLGERWSLGVLGVALLLMVISLFGPWWHDPVLGYLSGDTNKGLVAFALFSIGVCVLVRLAAPVRPTWLYPPIGVVSLTVFLVVGLHNSADVAITGSIFLTCAVLGGAVGTADSIAATIISFRQPTRASVVQAVPLPLPAQVTSSPADDHQRTLRSLGALRDEGLLTEAEFQAKKADILNRM